MCINLRKNLLVHKGCTPSPHICNVINNNMNIADKYLNFSPNAQQSKAIHKMVNFIDSDNEIFILKGSAGTGKTSIIKALTEYLGDKKIFQNLAAPTGRAAAVICRKTNQLARTMHSQIYIPEKVENSHLIRLLPKTNQVSQKTVFIVDEASMVSSILGENNTFLVNKPLLHDYISFVFSGNKENKIIFIGDEFQLHPIKEKHSAALSAKYLSDTFKLKCESYELDKVERHAENGNILTLATLLRDEMKKNITSNITLDIDKENYSRIALNRYLDSFDVHNLSKSIVICSSNRDVAYWNNSIRTTLGINKHSLVNNDIIYVHNAKFGVDGDKIQKGEYGRIVEIESPTEKYGELNFVDAKIEFPTQENEKKILSSKILLDSLNTDHGSLMAKQEKELLATVMRSNSRYRETNDKRDDKYLSALRIKHGYATTCHKAQGGEWDNVLIHPWRLGKDLRWSYTAITRARKEVYSYAA